MSKKYLRSDMSEQEARFLTCGNVFWGEENALTGIYKIIGRFKELEELGREEELSYYKPNNDFRFKYENRGITELSIILKAKYGGKQMSRKKIKILSRKWGMTPVLISSNCACIIDEIITYINCNTILKSECDKYLSNIESGWENLMPIQFDFLSTRFTDQHQNYRLAGEIINDLSAKRFD